MSPPDSTHRPTDGPDAASGREGPVSRDATVEVAAGRWVLRAVSGGENGAQFTATLTAGGDGPPLGSVTRSNLLKLEEALGWAIPLLVHEELHLAAFADPPPAAADGDDAPPDAALHDDAWRPSRASAVRIGQDPPFSYGALLRADRPHHRWRPGPVDLDLFAASVEDEPGALYRMSEPTRPGRPPEVVFTGVVVGIPDRETLTSDDAVRHVLRELARRAVADDGLTLRQHAFVVRHHDLLVGAAGEPPDHPYPRGTRVAVHDGDLSRTATGTVLAVLDSPTGRGYLWRPDVADLPGHPWQHHPTWALRAATQDTQATLAGPDTGVDGPAASPVQATGALVATVDEPRFSTATVLRALLGSGTGLSYEVQPLDAALPAVRLAATAVVPLRAAAWRSLDDLLTARAAAGLPPADGELIATRRGLALALEEGGETSFVAPREIDPELPSALDPTDGATPTLVPAGLRRTDATGGPATSRWPTLRRSGDLVSIEDPAVGRLDVNRKAFHAAIRRPADELRAALARRPWLPRGEGRPLFVVAALAAQHAAADLGLLPEAHASRPPDTARPATPEGPPSAPSASTPGPDPGPGPGL